MLAKADQGRLPWASGLLPALGVGLALRAWYLFDLSRQPFFGFPIVDSLTYDRLARAIAAGDAGGAFFRPPLYPYFLSLIYGLGGGQGAVAWAQFVLSLGAAVPVYLLAGRWYGPRAASLAAWITVLYPLRIFFEGEILAVTLFGALLSWGMWLYWTGVEDVRPGRLFLAGALLGGAILTRPNLLLALPFILCGSFLAFPRRPAARWKALCWSAPGLFAVLLPATAHNWAAGGEFIPVAANGGVNFYLGNRAGATGETPLPPGLKWQDTIQEPLRQGAWTLAAQDRFWWERSLRSIEEDPRRWLTLLGRKAALFWNAYESSNNKALGYFTGVSFPVRHYRWWFGALVCLSAAAFALTPPGPATLQVGSLLFGYCVAVSLFFVTARYRVPLVPFLALLSGGALAGSWERSRRPGPARVAAAVALAAVAALAVFPVPFAGTSSRIDPDFQMGQIYLGRGEPAMAETHLRKALARGGDDPDVLNSLGASRFMVGDYEGAERFYLEALRKGEYSEVFYNLGVVYEKSGPRRLDEARSAYRRSLEINPLERRAAANLRYLEEGR